MIEMRTRLRGRDLYLAVGIVALAAVLRWYRLVEWDMWTDEVQTLWISMSGRYIEGPMYSTAPVNFWLTRLSADLLGAGELGLRFVPFFAGVATVAIFLWSTTKWFGSRTALLGGLFLALSLWHVGWSQTGRHFALQTLLVLLAMHFFLVTWLDGRAWGAWLSTLFLLVGILTHSSTVFFLAAFLAFLAIAWLAGVVDATARHKPKDVIIAGVPYVVVLAVYLPVFFTVGQYLVTNKEAWNPPYNIVGSLLFYLPPWLILTAAAGSLVLSVRGKRDCATLLALLFLIPAGLVTVSASITIASAAYCLASLPALAILFGAALDWLVDLPGDRAVRWATVAVTCGLFLTEAASLAHYYFIYNGLKAPWKAAIEFVEQRRLPGEEFYASEGDVAQYYLGRSEAQWVGRSPMEPEETGAWYVVYEAGGAFPGSKSAAYRKLEAFASLKGVFPVFYGAKDRTLVVFHSEAR